MRTLRLALVSVLATSFIGAPAPAHAATADNMNLRFHPIVLAVGMVAVEWDFVLNDQWTLGPSLAIWRFESEEDNAFFQNAFKINGFAAGVRANWFMEGVFTDGLYIGPFAKLAKVRVETTDSLGEDVSGEASGLNVGSLVGYAWFWDMFNIMLGGGLAIPLGDDEVEVKNSAGTVTKKVKGDRNGNLALEFSLGWTF